MHEVATYLERVMLEHISSNQVEHMQKKEEEVPMEKEKLLKIVEDFQTKFSTSQTMEE